ncbi:MAG: M1 family metallopeptidase [Calditrichaeota bacterium]|nr:M1 family metallopeptidase [Calditrichota bacterium]
MSHGILALLVCCLFAGAEIRAAHITHHSLVLELDLESHTLQGRDAIQVEGIGGSFHILIGKAYQITAIQVGNATTYAEYLPANAALFGVRDDPRDASFWASVWAVPLPMTEGKATGEYVIRWSGTAFDTAGLSGFSHDRLATEVNAFVGKEGVYLSSEAVYYPRIPRDLASFQTEVILPADYRVVTSGQCTLDEATEGTRRVVHNEPNPIDGLTICAGRWIRESLRHGGVLLETFFYPEDTALAATYLNALVEALDIFTPRIAPYPFAKFAVAENFFETGYGMPGFTLLGRTVVKLPFIPRTSLPHELLHNWWGNSVYVDDTLGNWCEGLTTYLSDYMYREIESDSAARDYRSTILRDYTAYVGPGGAIPLVEFRERTNPALRAVGYGKSAMLFHALHRLLGEEAFATALRRFYANSQFQFASWADIEYEFEMASGQDLGPFFRQWLFRSDAPKLHLGQLKATKNGAQYRVELEVLQPTEPPFELEFPVKVYCEGGVEVEQPIRISTGRVLSTMVTPARPKRVALDPDAHAFRLLWPDEQPATIAGIIGAPNRLFVLGDAAEADFRPHEEQLFQSLIAEWGGEIVEGLAWQDSAAPDVAVIIPWRFGRLLDANWPDFGKEVEQSSGNMALAKTLLSLPNSSFDTTILAGKDNKGRLLLLVNAAQPEALDALGRKLPHYGKYSYLGFREGKCTLKGIWQPISPQTVREVTIP